MIFDESTFPFANQEKLPLANYDFLVRAEPSPLITHMLLQPYPAGHPHVPSLNIHNTLSRVPLSYQPPTVVPTPSYGPKTSQTDPQTLISVRFSPGSSSPSRYTPPLERGVPPAVHESCTHFPSCHSQQTRDFQA